LTVREVTLGKMEFVNTIDDQGRFLGFRANISDESIQINSHTQSYLDARRLYQSFNNGPIGLGYEENPPIVPENVPIFLESTLSAQ